MPGWRETYERLRELDKVSPLEPAKLIELGTSAYLTGHDGEGFDALMRAHQGFVQQRDLRQAGGTAAQIASIFISRGDAAQAAGWMARATRLLDECAEPAVERGYLLVPAARQSIISGNIADGESKFAEAAEIGEQFGDADLTSIARQGRGRALIELGDVERGVALLDEAMVAVTAGEVSTIIAGIVYCSVLSACADLFDIGRAREWTQALTRWCDAQPDMVPYRGECLVHRAEIISLQGVWPDALNEAQLACDRLSHPPGLPAFGAALYQVAEIHRLRGELDKAEAAYRTRGRIGTIAVPRPGAAAAGSRPARRCDGRDLPGAAGGTAAPGAIEGAERRRGNHAGLRRHRRGAPRGRRARRARANPRDSIRARDCRQSAGRRPARRGRSVFGTHGLPDRLDALVRAECAVRSRAHAGVDRRGLPGARRQGQRRNRARRRHAGRSSSSGRGPTSTVCSRRARRRMPSQA